MRFKTLALVGTLALAGCGSQTYTAQSVKPTAQHVTTAAKPVKPSCPAGMVYNPKILSNGGCLNRCPVGMKTNQDGTLVGASHGVDGSYCQRLANRILAKDAQAQAQGEDNSPCPGHGICGQGAAPQSPENLSCPDSYILAQSAEGKAICQLVPGPPQDNPTVAACLRQHGDSKEGVYIGAMEACGDLVIRQQNGQLGPGPAQVQPIN